MAKVDCELDTKSSFLQKAYHRSTNRTSMDWFRSVLEVHKFLPAKDILIGASVVHTTWTRASDSEELWTLLCERLESISPSLPPKSAYRMSAFSKVRLVLIHKASMQFFNCVETQWESAIPLSQSLIADYCSSATILPDGSVFLCGGGETAIRSNRYQFKYTKDAHRIQSDGAVTPLQSMCVPRAHHALIAVQGVVYVFGGKTSFSSIFLHSCEKWPGPADLCCERVSWKALPDSPRGIAGCNPCSHQLSIYLLYHGRPTTVAAFSTIANTFIEWVSLMKNQAYQEGSVVVYNGELLVLQTLVVNTIAWEEGQGRVRESKGLQGVLANGVICPVLIQSQLFYVDYVAKTAFCFDLIERRTTRIYRNPL